MDCQSSRTLQMPALGRPFKLGMLYDCRDDAIVPGITLWDPDHLKQHTGTQIKPNSLFEIMASESIEGKTSALKVEASLKASFLSGLVEVDGSAKYLNDQKTSQYQARVTLKYNATTKFEELSMKHLGRGNVTHPDVFDKGIATHVVTGVVYGAQAFFVFDRKVSESESKQDVQGNLHLTVKKFLSIEGKGDLKLNEEDWANASEFSCKFYGDFNLGESPVTFKDAVNVYKTLPTLLGTNGERAVPVTVWLLPLTTLDSAAARLVREISLHLVNEAQRLLEDFNDLDMRCNDALTTKTLEDFPQIRKKIRLFQDFCKEFRLNFQRLLARKLPAIRGGGEEEAELAAIIREKTSSPFKSSNLSEWLELKERELGVLRSYTSMKNARVVQPKGVDEQILSRDKCVCFVFTSLGQNEPYLESLQKYLKGDTSPAAQPLEEEQWFESVDVVNAMRHKAKLFSDFAEANKENPDVTFLMMSQTDENHKGSSIYLYEAGSLPNKDFEPTSKPEKITVVDLDYNKVTLELSPPKFGAKNITSFRVEFSRDGGDEWRQITAPGTELTLENLDPNTEYKVRCQAVSRVGVSPVYEMKDSIKTLPCSAPRNLQVAMSSTEMLIKWEKPMVFGKNAELVGFMVEYAPSDGDRPLPWKQQYSVRQRLDVSGLQPDTAYAVRLYCDCGLSGRSKCTDVTYAMAMRREFGRLAEHLKHMSKQIRCDSYPPQFRLPLTEEDLDIDGCRMFSLGKESIRPNRTVMVLGATGAGKSTLINGIVNYITGVERKDNFRLKLVHEDPSRSQADSQTCEVSVYKLHYEEGYRVPFSLTVVDTPGFGDTKGIQRDKEITEQIQKLFSSSRGVTHIDAICFVVQASLTRLTHTQRYIFESVLSIFGRDVAENILLLVTFADGKQPPVLDAINAAGIPCPKNEVGLPVYYKFNNSVLFSDNRDADRDADGSEDDAEDDFDQIFWQMGVKSMQRFLTDLNKMETKSLQMTKDVLKERKQLETAVEGLLPQVKAALAKIQEIKTTMERMKDHEADMRSNENYEIEVEVIKPVQAQLTNKREYLTNCQACHVTCHYPCAIKDDSKKDGCAAMNTVGTCTVCPGKCHWSAHLNQAFRWEYTPVKQKQTLRDMKQKYAKAKEEKLTMEQIIQRQEEEIENLQDVVVSLIDQSAQSLTRLSEMALRPNPLTAPDYIHMMIEGEKSERKPGYKERIQALEMMMEKAKIISQVCKKDAVRRPQESEELQPGKKMRVWRNVFNVFQK